jgi:hypothetical protein
MLYLQIIPAAEKEFWNTVKLKAVSTFLLPNCPFLFIIPFFQRSIIPQFHHSHLNFSQAKLR